MKTYHPQHKKRGQFHLLTDFLYEDVSNTNLENLDPVHLSGGKKEIRKQDLQLSSPTHSRILAESKTKSLRMKKQQKSSDHILGQSTVHNANFTP